LQKKKKAPMPDSLRVRALKKMKLKLRDQIAWLENVGANGRPVTGDQTEVNASRGKPVSKISRLKSNHLRHRSAKRCPSSG